MRWTTKKITELLTKSDRAVYRALLRLDGENKLTGNERDLALLVRTWDRHGESVKGVSHPLDSGDMKKARVITLRFVERLSEIANAA